MKKTGASLVVYALEQLPIRYTFGIPGVHNTELYDELNKSKKIIPKLVTHEVGGAFMADAISRTSKNIGTIVTVPAAGITHAMSGIGEAFLDGIPMMVISGGIRRDTGKSFQLHDINQQKIMEGITKKTYLISNHKEIVPLIYEAYHVATSGEPGPVFIEIPVNIQLFEGEAGDFEKIKPLTPLQINISIDLIKEAAELLSNSKNPGIFLGWGAKDATSHSIELAEFLQSPVSTTLQGLSVFPGNHPLHTGMGFSSASIPAAMEAFRNCDTLLAVGCRFAEIPTGSFGVKVPENLIHVDINNNVFNKNYPAKITIEGDATYVVQKILEEIKKIRNPSINKNLKESISLNKKKYIEEWTSHQNEKVNPAIFFQNLRKILNEDAFVVVDDGNHTFLAAELFTSVKSGHFISPTDFNCMGYCVPAAIGVKLANPENQVVGIVGDGAFLMTCMEILTATRDKLGVVYFIFNDGELSQISQGQEIPYNRKTCTVLQSLNFSGLSQTVGAFYLEINSNSEIQSIITEAMRKSGDGIPGIVNVRIDYSKRTRFTKGVVKEVSGGFPFSDKLRIVGRALKRKITG